MKLEQAINTNYLEDSKLIEIKKNFLKSEPNHVVLDDFLSPGIMRQIDDFIASNAKLTEHKHLYKDEYKANQTTDQYSNVPQWVWEKVSNKKKFVKRKWWSKQTKRQFNALSSIEKKMLDILNIFSNKDFVNLLYSMTNKKITNPHHADADFFAMGNNDMCNIHNDCMPNRVLCMSIYLNKNWNESNGGELCFVGNNIDSPLKIAPIYNRVALFDPCSRGSDHWVEKVNCNFNRYNILNWYTGK